MSTTPGALPTALERLWDALRADHPELPPARVAISTTPSISDHGPERWSLDDSGHLIGLTIGSDTLTAGPVAVLTAVLHEAAHVLNWTRGTKDTSGHGVYHNARYLSAAEEIGLSRPRGQGPTAARGVPTPVLPDVARERWAATLADLEPAIAQTLPYLASPDSARTGRQGRITAGCQCSPSRRVRVARTVYDLVPIVCGVCGGTFARQA
jgi:hypothetical protein